MNLSPEQTKVLKTIIQVGKAKGASRKELVSAIETGLVEANLTNPSGGDGSSVGWRQETASSYPNVNRMDVRGAASRYFSETAAAGRGNGKTAGQLAQSVQRSAFPARYDQRRGEALGLYRQFAKGGGGSSKPPKQSGGGGSVQRNTVIQTGTKSSFDQQAFDQAKRQFVLGTFLNSKNPNNPLLKLGVVSTTPPSTADFTTQTPFTKTTTKTIGTGSGNAPSVSKGTPGSSQLRSLAAAVAKRGSFVYKAETGDYANKALQEMARTGRATVDATGKRVVINPKLIEFLAAATRQGDVKINAIVNGNHTAGSNHYKGNAVDLDLTSGLGVNKIVSLARKFGGVRNYETSHIHLDF